MAMGEEGDLVLIHNEQLGKMIPRFGNTEYLVKKREGSRVELESVDRQKTARNVSRVRKVFKEVEEKTDDENQEHEELRRNWNYAAMHK
jgi:hypothetical protein